MSSTGIRSGIAMLLVCVGVAILPFLRHRRLNVSVTGQLLTQQYADILLDLATLEDDYRQGYYNEADYMMRRDTLRQQAISVLQQLDVSSIHMDDPHASDAIENLITNYRQQERSS